MHSTRRRASAMSCALAALIALTLLAAPASGGPASAAPRAGVAARAACVAPTLSGWSVRQLADQVVAVPIQAGQVGTLAPMVRAGFGGILLFGTVAPPTLGQTIARLQRLVAAPLGPLVMTDEEGGGVLRLDNLVAPFPWPRTMAATMTPSQIRAVGKRVGAQLLAAGVDTDLAPVLDVDGRNVEPGVADPDGYRSFGGRPSTVITDGTAFLAGLRAAGVLPVAKHFPGLGGSTGNTDYGPASTLPWPTLKASALHTFEAAFLRGAPAVMVANAHVPGLTPLPASISPEVMTGALRTWLGFTGLVVTDSLTSGAIAATHLGVPTAAVRAVAAGADLVLLGAQPSTAADVALAQQVSNAIVAAVHHGALSRSALEGAVAHLLAAKASLRC